MAKSKFPKIIYVGEDSAEGEKFLVADGDYKALSIQHEAREVAVYQLMRVVKLINSTDVVDA